MARVPDPVANRQMDPPFDAPASVAFLGDRVLVTNQSYPAGNPDHWAVFDVFAGEPGQPLFRPDLSGRGSAPGAGQPGASSPRQLGLELRLRLTYRRGRTARGAPCARRRVRATLRGRDIERVRSAIFRLDRRRAKRDRRPPFRAIVYRPRGERAGARRVRVVATLDDGGRTALGARVRTCPAR